MDLSPRSLENQVCIPTAITFSRLNPQPIRSPIGSRKETFNSLKAQEIDNAQTKARHIILQSRLEGNEIPHSCCYQGYLCTCRIIAENTEIKVAGVKSVKSVKFKESVKKDSNPKSKLSFKFETGKGESNMRIRQVTRLTHQICECIRDIDKTSSARNITKEFITLYELQVKNKRLEEYLNFGRRKLFILKREINHLVGDVALKKNDFKWFRLLSTVSRNLYNLLLGLKNISESMIYDSVWLIFYKELLHTSWRLFYVASTIGIKFTEQDILKKLDSQFSKEENSDLDKPSITYSESMDSSSDLLHLSLDDKCLELLHPRNIRRQIATLARVSLSNKINKIKESEIKILAPLNMIRMMEEDEPKQKKYLKSTKKNLKLYGRQQRGISHKSDNDQIENYSEELKNGLPARRSFSRHNMEAKYLEIFNQKDILSSHTVEEHIQNDIARHQEQVSPDDLMTRIHYLHEKVCKINENWEETEIKIEELRSHAHGEDSQEAHQLILNEAQYLLQELQIEAA